MNESGRQLVEKDFRNGKEGYLVIMKITQIEALEDLRRGELIFRTRNKSGFNYRSLTSLCLMKITNNIKIYKSLKPESSK